MQKMEKIILKHKNREEARMETPLSSKIDALVDKIEKDNQIIWLLLINHNNVHVGGQVLVNLAPLPPIMPPNREYHTG